MSYSAETCDGNFFVRISPYGKIWMHKKELEVSDLNSVFHISGTILTVLLPTEIDHHNAEQIRKEADYLIQTKKIRTLILDFSQAEFMDSSGIGMIIGRYKMIRFLGGKVIAVHVNGRMHRILQMSGIYHYIDVCEDIADIEV